MLATARRRISSTIMNIPCQVSNIPCQVTFNAMMSDGVESVISFTDDEQSIWSFNGTDSRWEPEESMPPSNSNNSPKFPQRRGSVIVDPQSAAVDLPRLPRRRNTVIRHGSTDSSKLSSACSPTPSPPRALRRRNMSPPRVPCRKRSQEGGVALAKYKDMVKEHSRRSLMIKQQSVQRLVQQFDHHQLVKQQSLEHLVKQQSLRQHLVKQQSVPGKVNGSPNKRMAMAA